MYVTASREDFRKAEVYEKLIAERRRLDDRDERRWRECIDWDYYAGMYEEPIPHGRYVHGAFRVSESNPVCKDCDGRMVYPVASFLQMPKAHFVSPSCSFLLPPFSAEIAHAVGLPARQIMLKRNATAINIAKHRGLDDRAVLQNAVYRAFYVLRDKPSERPSYYTVIGDGEYYDVANLDFDPRKRFIEVVDWRRVRVESFECMLNISIRLGGFVHLVHGARGAKRWL